jgi:hypothetical protein
LLFFAEGLLGHRPGRVRARAGILRLLTRGATLGRALLALVAVI